MTISNQSDNINNEIYHFARYCEDSMMHLTNVNKETSEESKSRYKNIQTIFQKIKSQLNILLGSNDLNLSDFQKHTKSDTDLESIFQIFNEFHRGLSSATEGNNGHEMPILDQLEAIENEMKKFEEFCSKKTIRIQEIAEGKKKGNPLEIHKAAKSQLDELNKKLTGVQPVQKDSVEISNDYYKYTGMKDTLETTYRKFIEQFVTYFPCEEIDYGASLVSSKKKWPDSRNERGSIHELMDPLRQKFPIRREIRGDGNCFFSSIITGFLEYLVRERKCAEYIESLSFNTTESPGKEILIKSLYDLIENPLCLEAQLQNTKTILSCVHYFRHLAGDFIKGNEQKFMDPITSFGKDIPTYIKEDVLKMGIDADDIVITALSSAINFPILIYDQTEKRITETFIGSKKCTKEDSHMNLCRSGGHYFCLYAQEKSGCLIS